MEKSTREKLKNSPELLELADMGMIRVTGVYGPQDLHKKDTPPNVKRELIKSLNTSK